MYNAEKYIGDCLDSLIAQTFKDFEVIVVDDCSTDKSCEVVESYKSKLNLKLIRSKKNFGYPGLTRNRGIEKARGKYLCFVDADDAIVSNALKGIYAFAEKFQADVLHFDKYLLAPDDTVTTDPKKLIVNRRKMIEHVEEPTPLTNDISTRIDKFIKGKFVWEPWNNVIRREFIEKNKLKFPPDLSICDDLLFNFTTITTAEKVVIMPQAFYVWRQRKDSLSKEKMPAEKAVRKIGGDIIRGLDFLENFLNRHKIFKEININRFEIFSFFAEFQLNTLSIFYADKPLYKFEKAFIKELATIENKDAIIAFLFSYINLVKLDFNAHLNENAKLKEHVVKMIEISNHRNVENQNLKSVISDDVLLQISKA